MTTDIREPDVLPTARTRVMTRVRALLAKAESTTFPEEAEALTTKAQELITRYALTDALQHDDADLGDAPQSVVVHLDRPYLAAKARLLTAVATANQCQVVFSDGWSVGTLFGYPADLDGVEVLYTSLLLQATRDALSLGSVRDASGRSRTRAFRRAFLTAFAHRIGERLEAAREAAMREAERDYDQSLLPVVAARSDRVEAAVRAAFPHVTSHRMRVSHHGGLVAGRAAADRAQLSPSLDGERPALRLLPDPS